STNAARVIASAATPSRLPDISRVNKGRAGAVKEEPKAVASAAAKAAPEKPVVKAPARVVEVAESKPVAQTPAQTPAKVPAKTPAKSSAKPAAPAPVAEPKVPQPGMRSDTSRRPPTAPPRSMADMPPVRQLGLRATRPEEIASVRPLEARSGRPSEARTPKSSADINGYSAAVRYLMERTDFERMRTVRYNETTFKLDRMHQLLAKLGNPHQHIRTVHVGGTNGKGSTVHMIASMRQACGYTVGLYTSPHLVELRERIVINGQPIEKAAFAETMKQVAKAAEKAGVEPTFFEAVTAVCFKHFAEQAVDIAVIEVGLGGRLDSTNVILPEASVITSIDFDHTKLLGNTLEEIAGEKAGIFKKDVPAFIFESDPAVEAVFREVAERVGAPLRVVNKDIDYSARFCVTEDLGPHTRVCLYTKTSRLEHLPVPLPGEHQASNCGLALAVVDHLKTVGFDCPEDKITAGLAATRVPGRMQLVWDRPRVLVDGAHNPSAVGALMRCVGAHVPYDSMICVFGCCNDKDVPGLIDKVNLGADKVIFTRAAGNPRSADPEDLQKLFNERSGKMSQVARTLPEALEMATRAVSREDLVCVTGSFYLVGETLKHIQHFDRSKGGKIPAQVPEVD
ncbi:MAG: bifunctional folylpolyglutamate synthase/dihydrofolate synthase, partial [Planctomycetota bacterium]